MLLCSGVSVSVWVAIAWNIVIAGTLTQLLADLEWLPGPIAGPWANNRQFFVLVTSGCVLLPLVSIPTFHKLRYISSLSVVAMLFVTFAVVFRVSPAPVSHAFAPRATA